MTMRKCLLVDKVRNGYSASPSYRITIQEGMLWWKRTVKYTSIVPTTTSKKNLITHSWYRHEAYTLDGSVSDCLVKRVDDQILIHYLDLCLNVAKLNGETR